MGDCYYTVPWGIEDRTTIICRVYENKLTWPEIDVSSTLFDNLGKLSNTDLKSADKLAGRYNEFSFILIRIRLKFSPDLTISNV